jgi:hypothetical protein
MEAFCKPKSITERCPRMFRTIHRNKNIFDHGRVAPLPLAVAASLPLCLAMRKQMTALQLL